MWRFLQVGSLTAACFYPAATMILIKYKDHPLVKPIYEAAKQAKKTFDCQQSFSESDLQLAREAQEDCIRRSENPVATRERLKSLEFYYSKPSGTSLGAAYHLHDMICVKKETFDSFPPEEKKWILAHELIHIDKEHQYHHAWELQAGLCVFAPFVFLYLGRSKNSTLASEFMQKKQILKAWSRELFITLSPPLLYCAARYYPMRRSGEYEADALASKRFGDNEEGYLVGIDSFITMMTLADAEGKRARELRELAKQAKAKSEELIDQWKAQSGKFTEKELNEERTRIEEETKKWHEKEISSLPPLSEIVKSNEKMKDDKQTARSYMLAMDSQVGKVGENSLEVDISVTYDKEPSYFDQVKSRLDAFYTSIITTHPTTPDRIVRLSSLYFQSKTNKFNQSSISSTSDKS